MSNDSNISDTVPIRECPQNDRYRILLNEFSAHFNKPPDFFVRVPGRVNLIGEHIDYCGYGVCPMALEQDIFLAVSLNSDANLSLHNIDAQYEDFNCQLTHFTITRSERAPKWYQYFLCGVKGILDLLPENSEGIRGMQVVVSGKVPQSAGLSSSSALVSAAALATSHANALPMSKEKMANLCAECERYIGTQGGGMDQAIAFLATEGCAKHIEFAPLRSRDITLPAGAVFVIAHSLANLNKAATSDFNQRVVECRLAAQIIAKKSGVKWWGVKKLGELQLKLGLNLDEMISMVEKLLHKDVYTKEEVIRELETTSDHLNEASLTPNTRDAARFKLYQRAMHVFQEARRVESFYATCSKPCDWETLPKLGRLISDSHKSLRDLYECSHPSLDRLVELSKDLALGARLTGAGWGGCIVALVSPNNVDKYLKMLQEDYYSQHIVADINSVLFATSPQSGACIYT